MKTTTTLLVCSAVLLLAGSPAAACDHRADRTGEADAAGVKRVVIQAEAGDLVVHGKNAAVKVLVRGEACASSASQLEKVQVETRRDGDTVTVKVRILRESTFGWNEASSLDLDVEVPSTAKVEIEDTSGDTVLRELGEVRLDDGSGDIQVSRVAGLELVDGSGDVEIEDAGDLRLEDGSGDLVVRRARGNVVIDEDGSGSIDLREVAGSVRVRSDGSGSIYVADVKGDFTVDDDGSGDIEHKNVGGRVSIPSQD